MITDAQMRAAYCAYHGCELDAINEAYFARFDTIVRGYVVLPLQHDVNRWRARATDAEFYIDETDR